MSESGDYDPGPWTGHDFSTARVAYDVHVNRSYSQAKTEKKTIKDLVPLSMTTESPYPLVIGIDQTGSMGKRTAIIASKMPYLEHEAKDYLGPLTEISFFAIGDATCGEDYPLQCRPFTNGPALNDRLKELVFEGGGGGTQQESYELAALYYARNVSLPNVGNSKKEDEFEEIEGSRFDRISEMVRLNLPQKGIMIFIGDEEPYAKIRKDLALKYAHVTLANDIDSKSVFEELKEKFSVYAVLIPYGNETDSNSVTSLRIHNNWCDLLGKDHVATLDAPDRVVDVIFGILAEERGRFPDFMAEIEDRQKDDENKVKTVYKSLATIHNFAEKPEDESKSVLHVSLDNDEEGDDLV